jgi:septum formation protein
LVLTKVSQTKKKLILASGSRIRRQLLEGIGLKFQVINSNVDEDLLKKELHGRPFREQVVRLAAEKARVVSMDNLEAFVIGSDNMCTIDDKIFDKPIDHEDAVNHLSSLSGKKHFQNNGISIFHEGREVWSNFDVTELEMKKLSLQEIEDYLNLDKPYSACGCYHFESNGKDLFTSINGLESTVMGLAMEHLIEKLNQLGVIEL